jgi:hypothetical protein
MRREASFKSSAFNTSEVREYFINDCCFGDDLAKWLIARLRQAGLETDNEPGQEDFGWFFNFNVSTGAHCCIVAFQEDDPEGIWHITLERQRGFIPSLLGRRGRGIDAQAVDAINTALRSAPEVRELHWAGEVA